MEPLGQEKHKNRKRSATGMWTCGYCQKAGALVTKAREPIQTY